MGTMIGPLTRILLRYGAAVLVTWGLLSSGVADRLAYDPDVYAVAQVVVGVVVALGTEVYYWAARKYGWST